MYLRKWSPIKYLMYLWLAILVWIFCRCESVATMHLAPVGSSSSSSSSGSNSLSLSSSTSVSSGSSSSSRNSIAEQLFANGMHYRSSVSTSPYQWRPSEVTTQRSATFTKTLDRRWTPSAQVESSSSSSSFSSSASYHHPINYANRVLVENANKQLISHGRSSKDQLAASSLSQSSSTTDNHSSSIISTSSSINVEPAAAAEQRLQHQWRLRMTQKRARRLAHRTQLAAAANRNRRDSVRPFPTTSTSQQLSPASSRRPPNQQGPNANLPAGGRRYCSARDPATLAFDAPIVFEGKVKSMSSDRRANFSVTFELVAVHKKYTKFYLPNNVRLQFSYRNNSECDIYRETYRERGIVREELEQGKVYFLFVKQIDVGNFTILGQPIRKTRRTTNGVLEGVSEKYGKRPEIYSITSNVTRQEGKRVRLVCKVRGQPPPKVTWFKDKRSINRNVTKYAQVHLKKRSELIIHSVIPSDAGEYECRAKNKYAKISNSTHVRITAKHSSTKQPTTPATPEPPYKPRPCRGPGAEHFCLNGGTCIHFEDLQEWACTCPKGFSGNKCENKDIDYHPTTSSKHQDCSYGYGYGGYYC